jgi:hypothetical protein
MIRATLFGHECHWDGELSEMLAQPASDYTRITEEPFAEDEVSARANALYARIQAVWKKRAEARDE